MKSKLKIAAAAAVFNIIRSQSAFANNLDVFTPTIWAQEAILQLQPNMLIGNLIHRDFENLLANYGDTVNVVKPGTFTMTRKGSPLENVTIQDATASSIQFKLNQNPQVAFMIADSEQAKSITDLFSTYLTPAVQALAQGIDAIASGQHTKFWKNGFAGGLGQLSSSTVNDQILELRERMNLYKVPEQNRVAIVGTRTETIGLKERMFVKVNESGSSDALRRGSLGQLYGFDIYAAQSQTSLQGVGMTGVTGAINHAGGYAAGSNSFVVDGFTGVAITAGMWIKISGDDTPLQVASASGTDTVGIVTTQKLQRDVADNAVITAINPGKVNFASGYLGTAGSVPGYAKAIVVDSFGGNLPALGMPVSFGAQTVVYTVIGVDTGNSTITLDRPLELNIADNDNINPAPVGQYNLGFQKNALAMVVRPLPKPKIGALASVISYNGLSLRVTISYDPYKQGHLVTIDCLMGINELDTNLGHVWLG
jgi:hypothetical protein